ncbi:hypothetical protein CLIB1444_14S02784 [[Candida] jaroonii]|uniref:Uncharacterized protein n=1 Tax=[Candida] jaroonii TaxID=467808 RepID=A0ACA9YEC6_9ASCO|nr:hypothetical protein CLIB1444_14S02784 [[Candida] jaroonii]
MSLPTNEDIELHLTLLRAIKRLKESVVLNPQYQESFREKLWELYVTNAVRNYIMFVSSLKIIHDQGEDIVKFIDELDIPLNILMVWHSFMLNPKSFYDNFKYNDFETFCKIPFPLPKVNSITNDVNETFKQFMTKYFNDFDTKPIDSFETLTYPVSCPNCKLSYGEINLFTRFNGGFADQFFETIGSCKCSSRLNHQVLRTFKLISDCKKPTPLPGSYKYFRSNITKSDVLLLKANEHIKGFLFTNEKELREILIEEFVHKYKHKFSIPELLLLRDYVETNPIYLTVENGLEIQEDLVACVIRQGKFIDKVLQTDWINNSFNWIKNNLASPTQKSMSISRYEEFFSLMKDSTHPIVPTIDIDLVWHTHQLNPRHYFSYSKKVTGTIIDHNDKIEKGRLNTSFKKTSELYEEKYGKAYSTCSCDSCTGKPEKTWKFLSQRVFKADTSQHISQHNAMRVITGPVTDAVVDENFPLKSHNYVVNPEEPANQYNSNHVDLYLNGKELDNVDFASACSEISNAVSSKEASTHPSKMYQEYLDEVKASKENSKAQIKNLSFGWAKKSPDFGFYFEPGPAKPRQPSRLFDPNFKPNRNNLNQSGNSNQYSSGFDDRSTEDTSYHQSTDSWGDQQSSGGNLSSCAGNSSSCGSGGSDSF